MHLGSRIFFLLAQDFMKVKGFRVNPIEIEGHLLEHPDVFDCCVIPVPDEFSYQIPKAFIVLTQAAKNRLRVDGPDSSADQIAVAEMKNKLIQVSMPVLCTLQCTVLFR